MRCFKKILLVLFYLSFFAFPAAAQNVLWQNNLVFYGDNTEFFEPFRLRETILGQQFESFLSAPTGVKTSLRGGLFADHRSALDAATNVLPILSFVYNTPGSEGVLGTLLPVERHGLLEPMEVTSLELTRPIEYGLQWIQKDGAVRADLFLNWQHLLTDSSREIFDYGGSARLVLDSGIALGAQIHSYHVGGAAYGGVVRNNFAGGAGLILESLMPLLGKSSLEVFGLGSNDTERPNYPGPINGSGLYAKGFFSPIDHWEVFGIAWVGKDFMSEEGDSNYNSYGYDGVYYKSDRHYEEAGIRYSTPIDDRVTFDFQIRSHWIEDAWAHSFRIAARAPFDIEIDVKKSNDHRRDAEGVEKNEKNL